MHVIRNLPDKEAAWDKEAAAHKVAMSSAVRAFMLAVLERF